MSEKKKKPALLVAQQNGRRKRGRLHGRTPLPKTIVTSDQDRTQAGYISQFLLPGAGQGLHLRDLVRITQRSERDVRKQIHIERRRHIPILSNNLDGYYLPSSKEEKDRCVDSLRRRAAEILEAADAIEKAEW